MKPKSFCLAAAFAMAGFCALGAPAFSQEHEAALLTDMFGQQGPEQSSFADSILSQVPFATIKDIVEQTRSVIGRPVSVEHTGGDDYVVHTGSHDLPVTLVLDDSGKIIGFLIKPAVEVSRDLADYLVDIANFDGDSAYLITRNGETLHTHRADALLAVGSSFKLGILAAMRDRMTTDNADWDTVIYLDDNDISAPSGILQTFRPGAPMTLHTLAALMISISDNTAADALLDYAGRDKVAETLGVDFVPKTRELFLLKAHEDLRNDYLAADAKARAGMVAQFDALPLLPSDRIGGQHIAGVEYYLPLERLCRLIGELSDLDVMSINPGVASPDDWSHIAYKGGSEQGVLNLTTQVRDANGNSYCVAATWNADGPVDETATISDYGSILKALRRSE